MDEKVVSIDKFKWEARKRQAKEKLNEAWQFCKNHPAESFALATTAAGGLFGLAKRADRNRAIKQEQDLKDRYVWDASLGQWWTMRRKPTTGQKLEIERRKKNGESMGDILSSMRLL